MVVDECQRIKNFNCKLVNDLKKYNTDNRLLLTGTPLQVSITTQIQFYSF
jgi:ATP-dependent DNA helicase